MPIYPIPDVRKMRPVNVTNSTLDTSKCEPFVLWQGSHVEKSGYSELSRLQIKSNQIIVTFYFVDIIIQILLRCAIKPLSETARVGNAAQALTVTPWAVGIRVSLLFYHSCIIFSTVLLKQAIIKTLTFYRGWCK